MKNLLTLIYFTFGFFVGIQLYTAVKRFNKVRQMYIQKFTYYKNHGLVHDSYCNIYIDIFSKFRMWMFIHFIFNNKISLDCLVDNQALYRNYLVSCKKTKQRKFDEDPNNVFVYWRDQMR